MRRLFRIAVLVCICLLLLLGTDRLVIETTENGVTKEVFAFAGERADASVFTLFGRSFTCNLSPFVSLRAALTEGCSRLPQLLGTCLSALFAALGAIFA